LCFNKAVSKWYGQWLPLKTEKYTWSPSWPFAKILSHPHWKHRRPQGTTAGAGAGLLVWVGSN
jgi:hypothetical protein